MITEAWAWFNRPLFSPRTVAIFMLTAVFLCSCGAASYNEGDNDDPPPANPCAELRPEDRPVNCEE